MLSKNRYILEIEMYQANQISDQDGNLLTATLRKNDSNLNYGDVIEYWQTDSSFREFFCSLIKNSGFDALVWEMPPVTMNTLNQDFEFILLNAPDLIFAPDYDTFSEYYKEGGDDAGIVAFENLGKDAVLVVPSPQVADVDYSNLATFLRNSPLDQQHALWRVVGRTLEQHISDTPIWLSTAGGGVAWLHVRLDSRPKYYRHKPYRIST